MVRCIGAAVARAAACALVGWSASAASAQQLGILIQGAIDNGRGGLVLSADYDQTSPTGPFGSTACCLASDSETGTPNFLAATGEVEFGRIRVHAAQETLQQGNFENRGGALFTRGSIHDLITVNSGTGTGTLRGMVRFDGTLVASATSESTDEAFAEATLSIPGDPGLAVTRRITNHTGSPFATGDSFGDYLVELSYVDGLEFAIQIAATAVTQTSSQYNFSFPGGASSADSDLRTTFTWMGAEVLDSEGAVVPQATISSASGFDWKAGIPVPEPDAPLGALAVTLALAQARRRRRRSATSNPPEIEEP
jgi:hypothetical protein